MTAENRFSAGDHTWMVCAYKESPYLENCIQSLLGQTVRSNIRITTSTPNDYILKTAEKYGIGVKINREKPGIGSDWNFALQNGETELLTIAHQDDLYAADYTEKMLERMNRAKKPILFASDYGELRNGEKVENNRLLRIKHILVIPMRMFPGRRFARRMTLAIGNAICCPSITYRKSIMNDYPFSTDYQCNLDWDMTERLSKLKGSFAYYPHPLMYHRIHEESTTTELIENQIRTKEDYEIMCRFWPGWIAGKLNKLYAKSENSNSI